MINKLKNKIISAIRKLGYDIVKYNDYRVNKNIYKKYNRKEIISKKDALDALLSVGRLPLSYFEYFTRPNNSSVLIDQLEKKWWNEVGRIIEKIWVFPEDVSKAYRGKYIENASNFFTNKNIEKAVVLEIGCGNGWLGKLIANENISYHGVDFSETQINLANKNLANSTNPYQISYYLLDDFAKLPDLNKINCVIFNSFLHHLYLNELESLFIKLQKSIKENSKFFLFEPVYWKDENFENNKIDKSLLNIAINTATKLTNDVKKEAMLKSVYDTDTEIEINLIMEESNRNGFHFSPKEVPFKLSEICSLLNKYCEVKEFYPVGVTNIDAAQTLAKITNYNQRKKCTDILYPLVEEIDKFLVTNNYLKINDNYVFTCFECILKN